MASPQYHNKLCSADVAVQAIQSGINRVFMTGNCSVPKELWGRWCAARSWRTWRSSRC